MPKPTDILFMAQNKTMVNVKLQEHGRQHRKPLGATRGTSVVAKSSVIAES
jgi:hypothetical protein